MTRLILSLNDDDDFNVFLVTDSSKYKRDDDDDDGDDITSILRSSISSSNVITMTSAITNTVTSIRALSLGTIIDATTLSSLPSSLSSLLIDVVVFGDVFMDSVTAHIAMFRMAPYQVAFWGHPFTSGNTILITTIAIIIIIIIIRLSEYRLLHFGSRL